MNEYISYGQQLYLSLCDEISRESSGKVAQSHIIIGKNGSGKTDILKRLLESFLNVKAQSQIFPVYIDGRSLFSTEDILCACFDAVGQDVERRGVQDLIVWQRNYSQRILLLVDDIHYYFKRTDTTENYKLRGLLNIAGGPMLIGASEEVLPAFVDYGAAFYNWFRLSYIPNLSAEDIDCLLSPHNEARGFKLMSYLPKTLGSINLVKMIIRHSRDEKMDLFILKEHRSLYYQKIYDDMAMHAQRILTKLACQDGDVNLRELRNLTGLTSGTLSPYLKSLVKNGFITKKSTNAKNGMYQISDPLFKLWLQ